MGKGWRITGRKEHEEFTISGLSDIIKTIVAHVASGVTMVDSTIGPVILSANYALTARQEDTVHLESLLSNFQLRESGVYVDDRARCHGRNQCMKIGP